MLPIHRILVVPITISIVASACGSEEPRLARLRAGVVAGAASAEVTYNVNGESITVEVVAGDDLDAEVEVDGDIEIDLVISNAGDVGGVRCMIAGVAVGAGAVSGTESATCSVEGRVESDVVAVSFDGESTDRSGVALVGDQFTVAVPEGYPKVSSSGGRVTFEGGDGEVWIDDAADDSGAVTPADFAENYGGVGTEPLTISGIDGVITEFEDNETSFVTILDDDWYVFGADARRSDHVELLTELVESIANG